MDALLTPSELAQIELLRLETRRKFVGSRQGGHISPKKGQGTDFADFRKYELGDNPRYIDWKLYGKTDRLYVKRFQEEQDLLISVFLDGTASMGIETEVEKWRFACRISLAFGYIGLLQQDKVQLSILGQKPAPQVQGGHGFQQLLRSTAAVRDGSRQPFGELLRKAAFALKFPGIAIIVSDFHCSLQEVDAALKPLLAKNVDIVALQIVGSKDYMPVTEPGRVVDSETGDEFDLGVESEKDLERLISAHTQSLRTYFTQRQIGFAQASSKDALLPVIQKVLKELRI